MIIRDSGLLFWVTLSYVRWMSYGYET